MPFDTKPSYPKLRRYGRCNRSKKSASSSSIRLSSLVRDSHLTWFARLNTYISLTPLANQLIEDLSGCSSASRMKDLLVLPKNPTVRVPDHLQPRLRVFSLSLAWLLLMLYLQPNIPVQPSISSHEFQALQREAEVSV